MNTIESAPEVEVASIQAKRHTLYLPPALDARINSTMARLESPHGTKSHWTVMGLNIVLDALEGDWEKVGDRLKRLVHQEMEVNVKGDKK